MDGDCVGQDDVDSGNSAVAQLVLVVFEAMALTHLMIINSREIVPECLVTLPPAVSWL